MLLWATPFSASAMRVAHTNLLCGKPIISTADLVFSLVLQGLPLGANELGQSMPPRSCCERLASASICVSVKAAQLKSSGKGWTVMVLICSAALFAAWKRAPRT